MRAAEVAPRRDTRVARLLSDVAHAQDALAPLANAREFQETPLTYQDLLRDGLALMGGTTPGEPDESSAHQVLAAFADAPILTALRRTLEIVDRKLDVDVAAA